MSRFALLSLVLMAVHGEAWGVSCQPIVEPLEPAVADYYASADVVVSGQVISGNTKPQRIRVEAVWKGRVAEEVWIDKFNTYSDGGRQVFFANVSDGGQYSGLECAMFAEPERVIDILERDYGAGQSPIAQPMRFAITWHMAIVFLVLAGVVAITLWLAQTTATKSA